jgi:hypothetical protein
VRLFMIISHVKIIAFQISLFCTNYRFSNTVLYIINRIIHGCLEIPDLFLVLNMISHSFAALTREISCSTLEINLVFPRTNVLFSISFLWMYNKTIIGFGLPIYGIKNYNSFNNSLIRLILFSPGYVWNVCASIGSGHKKNASDW